MEPLIVDSSQIKNNDLNYLGGKGRNLALLSKNNIPVPPWFCVLSNAYKNHIESIQDNIKTILNATDFEEYKSIKKSCHKINVMITEQLLNSELTQDIKHKLISMGENKFFSVRSSGIQEDSIDLSFAGLFETYLYIPSHMVISNIIKCWSSVFSDRALAYFFKNDISPLDVHMAVVVQEMVESRKSGILFQANPMGRLEETVVVAGYGLGEGVVGNHVETDTYYYNRLTKTYRSITNNKDYQFVFNRNHGFGLEKIIVPDLLKNKEVLSHDELIKLISLSNEIDTIYNHYQDIEWAIANPGEVYILQSRPITTIPSGAKSLYDNSNIVENYPGISSPLTYNITKKIYKNNFLSAFNYIGYSSKFLKQYEVYFSDMIQIIQGRIYYNLSNWYQILSLLPGGFSLLSEYLEEMLGVDRRNEYELKNKKSYLKTVRNFKVITILLWKFLNWNRIFKAYKKEFNSLYEYCKNIISSERDAIELSKVHEHLFFTIPKIFNKICINDFYVMVLTGIARNLLSSVTSDNGENILNGLLVGEEGMESVEPITSIMKMAEIVKSSPQLKKVLEEGDYLSDLNMMNIHFPEFYKLFMIHLEKYGDRGIRELQLECKGFRQDSQKLISLILNYANSDITMKKNKVHELHIRSSAKDELSKVVEKKFIKRKMINYIIKKIRFVLKNRESSRLDRSRIYGLYRNLYSLISENWVKAGILSEESDIFYLTSEEIIINIVHIDKDAINKIIIDRKKEWAEYDSYQPVDRMWLNGDVSKNFIPQKEYQAIDLENTDLTLHGLGCCPGIATGEAVVLRAPNESVNVTDKILVATNTDPGWVFLIMASKGIIVEKGSLLSHTVIIGRELGKPTIVGVSNATTKIPQASLITMDGTKGIIKFNKNLVG